MSERIGSLGRGNRSSGPHPPDDNSAVGERPEIHGSAGGSSDPRLSDAQGRRKVYCELGMETCPTGIHSGVAMAMIWGQIHARFQRAPRGACSGLTAVVGPGIAVALVSIGVLQMLSRRRRDAQRDSQAPGTNRLRGSTLNF